VVRDHTRNRSQQRGDAGVMSEKTKRTHVDLVDEIDEEPVEGILLIGDRNVDYKQFLRDKRLFYTQYGAGPSYLCKKASGHWWISFDHRESIFEHQLSRRTTRPRGKTEWQNFLLENAVEFWHKKLANNPEHQVAGSSSSWRRIIHNKVILALRDLSTRPLEELIAAISAVRCVKERSPENDLVKLAILAACRAHKDIPYRSEVLAVLGEDVQISRIANAFNQRLAGIGFAWLPAGQPRKAVVRVSKIHA
jgi:hypothetical protein